MPGFVRDDRGLTLVESGLQPSAMQSSASGTFATTVSLHVAPLSREMTA